MIKIILLTILLTTAVYPAGRNWYFDATNGSDTSPGDGTFEHPFKTLAKLSNIWSSVGAGDSILFKRGEVWRPSGGGNLLVPATNKAGSSSAYITIGAYSSGAKPVLSTKDCGSQYAIYMWGNKYFIVQDLEMRGRVYLYRGAAYIKILRCTIDGGANGDTAYDGANIMCYSDLRETAPYTWSWNPPNHIEIGYCVIQNTVSEIDGINLYTSGNNWIHDNNIYNCGAECIDINSGDNNLIERNICSGSGHNGIKLMSQYHTQEGSILRYNLVMAAGTGQRSLAILGIKNCRIYNNTFYAVNEANSLWFGSRSSSVPCCSPNVGNIFANNIFYGKNIVLVKDSDVEVTFKDNSTDNFAEADPWITNYFYNNYIYVPSDKVKIILINRTGTLTCVSEANYVENISSSEINLDAAYLPIWNSYANVEGTSFSNPGLIGPGWTNATTYGNFHLISGSPCLGTGYYVSDSLIDLDGNSVPSNNIDIGAFQTSQAKSLNLIYPVGGENFLVGSSHSISWSSVEVSNVNISYSINMGIDWTLIASDVAALKGNYSWTIPNTPSAFCKVKLVCSENQSVSSISGKSFTISPYIVVNAKVFLQGPYNGSDMNTDLNANNYLPVSQPYNSFPWNYNGSESVVSTFFHSQADIVDWVLVELRNAATSVGIASRAAFLKRNGVIVDLDGSSPVTFPGINAGNYYIIIRHRNHLAVMSANAVTLDSSGSLYDFTTGTSKYYGNDAASLETGVFGMYAGDANSDGQVTSTDFNIFNPNFVSAAKGYKTSDWNLDGQVNIVDFDIFNDNFNNAKITRVP